MTIDTARTHDRTEEATDALADRVFASLLGTLDVLTIHIGDQLGLYDLLHRRGPLDVAEVANASGTHPRYAREWLEQQAVAGLVDVLDPTAPRTSGATGSATPTRPSCATATAWRTRPPSPGCRRGRDAVAPTAARLPDRRGGRLERVRRADAHRTGRREPPLFLQVLGSDWLPSVPGLDRVLRDGGRVADMAAATVGPRSASPAPTRPSRSTATTSTRTRSKRLAATPLPRG